MEQRLLAWESPGFEQFGRGYGKRRRRFVHSQGQWHLKLSKESNSLLRWRLKLSSLLHWGLSCGVLYLRILSMRIRQMLSQVRGTLTQMVPAGRVRHRQPPLSIRFRTAERVVDFVPDSERVSKRVEVDFDVSAACALRVPVSQFLPGCAHRRGCCFAAMLDPVWSWGVAKASN